MAKKTNKPAEAQALPKGYVPDLKKVYKEEIVPALMKQFSYTTVMQVPRLVKITLNEGVGDATQDKKLVEEAAEELSITPTSSSVRACPSVRRSPSATSRCTSSSSV